jgi:cystathionine beta-lyase/cystathionine gamma-synthase
MSWERFETKALHSASDSNINQDSRSFLDSISYSIQDFIPLENKEDFYQRLVKRLCEIENTENGILCSSGYLAIYQTILGLTKRGDHILISKTCSISILKIVTNLKEKMGIKFSLIDLSKPRNWKSQLTKKTKLILVETLSIPNLLIPDLESINKFAKSHSLLFILDNSYCTPYLSRLSEIGADCMIYSDALYLDGQSRVSAGVILGKNKLIEKIKEGIADAEENYKHYCTFSTNHGHHNYLFSTVVVWYNARIVLAKDEQENQKILEEAKNNQYIKNLIK